MKYNINLNIDTSNSTWTEIHINGNMQYKLTINDISNNLDENYCGNYILL